MHAANSCGPAPEVERDEGGGRGVVSLECMNKNGMIFLPLVHLRRLAQANRMRERRFLALFLTRCLAKKIGCRAHMLNGVWILVVLLLYVFLFFSFLSLPFTNAHWKICKAGPHRTCARWWARQAIYAHALPPSAPCGDSATHLNSWFLEQGTHSLTIFSGEREGWHTRYLYTSVELEGRHHERNGRELQKVPSCAVTEHASWW